MSHISLWCLDKKNTSVFYITIGMNNTVYDLKKIIKKTKKPDYDSFSSDSLKLLKLKVPVNEEHIFDVQNFTLQDGENENANVVLMKNMQNIVNYFPEKQKNKTFPKKYQAPFKENDDLIRIIVEVPGETYQIM